MEWEEPSIHSEEYLLSLLQEETPQNESHILHGGGGEALSNSGLLNVSVKELQDALEMFKWFDLDNNDKINYKELYMGLKSLNPKITKDEIANTFKAIKDQGKDEISLKSFMKAVNKKIFNPQAFLRIEGLNKKNYEIRSTDVTLDRKIGEGSFGAVYIGKWQHIKVAVKYLKVLQENKKLPRDKIQDIINEFNKELAILVQVRHPYCIMFYGACIQDPNYFIVTEFCSNGTLTDFVRNRKVTSLNYWKIIYGMAIGIDYLHSRTPQLIHRDLKPDNILLDGDERPKIADFGMTTIKTDFKITDEACGTPIYMAPEIWQAQSYGSQVDVYAYGCILFYTTFQKDPFQCATIPECKKVILSAVRPVIPPQIHPVIREIITRSWNMDPRQRPSMSQIVNALSKYQYRKN